MSRPRGRPPRDKPSATPEDVLAAALQLLDAAGVEAFTMRAIAERLQINPMTIYHHFGDRDGLIEALSEQVYSDVEAPGPGNCFSRIEALLFAYHRKVRQHPGLALLIFSRPAVFPEQARRITELIANLLHEAGIPLQRSKLWVNILVDFTHGAAIATAMGKPDEPGHGVGSDGGYRDTLVELIERLKDGNTFQSGGATGPLKNS